MLPITAMASATLPSANRGCPELSILRFCLLDLKLFETCYGVGYVNLSTQGCDHETRT